MTWKLARTGTQCFCEAEASTDPGEEDVWAQKYVGLLCMRKDILKHHQAKVLRALAWSLRSRLETPAEEHDLNLALLISAVTWPQTKDASAQTQKSGSLN